MNYSKITHLIVIFFLLIIIPAAIGLVWGGADTLGSINCSIFGLGIPLLLMYIFVVVSLRNLYALIFVVLGVCLSNSIVSCFYAYRPHVLTQVAGMFLFFSHFIIIVISLIGIFVFWEDYGSKATIPFVIGILSLFVVVESGKVGHKIRLNVFNKRLPQYEDAVQMVENTITNEYLRWSGERIPKEFRHLAYLISARRKKDVLIVNFLWGGGFPVKHTAFVYISDGRLPGKGTDFRKDWPHCTRINEHWFKVSD